MEFSSCQGNRTHITRLQFRKAFFGLKKIQDVMLCFYIVFKILLFCDIFFYLKYFMSVYISFFFIKIYLFIQSNSEILDKFITLIR